MARPDDLPKDYHVVLNDGTERNVKSVKMSVSKLGALSFENAAGETALVFAPKSWLYVETENRDDRG